MPRTARYRVLGDPAAADEVWFVLHGYRQLAERFIRRFATLPGVGARRAVVAPEALSRFYIEDEVGPHDGSSRVGAAWMTRADREHEITDYVEYLDRLAEVLLAPAGARPAAGASVQSSESAARAPVRPEADDRRVVVLGFSQGAETASRWVTYGRTCPYELVLWGGGLAVDLDTARAREALEAVRIRLVVGREDRWATERAAESERRLRALGLEPDRIAYDGGHAVLADVLGEHWPE